MLKAALVFSLVSLAPVVLAQAPQITRIDTTDVGVYTADVQTSGAPDAQGLRSNILTNIRFAEPTRTIHMKMGLHFGFHYAIIGTPDRAPVELHMVTLYPQSGLHNPDVPRPIYRFDSTEKQKIGETNVYHGCILNHDWGLVPGDWTLEIWYGDQKLASETFTLIP